MSLNDYEDVEIPVEWLMEYFRNIRDNVNLGGQVVDIDYLPRLLEYAVADWMEEI